MAEQLLAEAILAARTARETAETVLAPAVAAKATANLAALAQALGDRALQVQWADGKSESYASRPAMEAELTALRQHAGGAKARILFTAPYAPYQPGDLALLNLLDAGFYARAGVAAFCDAAGNTVKLPTAGERKQRSLTDFWPRRGWLGNRPRNWVRG